MADILLLETTTRVCSVGLARDGHVIALREDLRQEYSHSSLLTVFMEEVLEEAALEPKDVDAVAVSQGPGSYTGLRIGVSAAKGFCFARDIPLIAVDTLRALAENGLHHLASTAGLLPPKQENVLLCPMIDARRMEVYYALFDLQLNTVKETAAEVIGSSSFQQDELQGAHIFFFGDGAEKCRDVLHHANTRYVGNINPGVRGMAACAESRYRREEFVDLAYFEPFYLKDFVAGKPRVKGLSS